jgi:hypothetical protein
MHWLALGLLLAAAASLTRQHLFQIDLPYVRSRMALHQQILAATARAPNRYRVLVPAVTEVAVRSLSRLLPLSRAFVLAYAAYTAVALVPVRLLSLLVLS